VKSLWRQSEASAWDVPRLALPGRGWDREARWLSLGSCGHCRTSELGCRRLGATTGRVGSSRVRAARRRRSLRCWALWWCACW